MNKVKQNQKKQAIPLVLNSDILIYTEFFCTVILSSQHIVELFCLNIQNTIMLTNNNMH